MLDELKAKAKIISTGGTPNFANIGKLKEPQNIGPELVFNDMMMVEDGFAQMTTGFQCLQA